MMFALGASDVDSVNDVHCVNDVTPFGVMSKHSIIFAIAIASLCVA